MKKFTIFIFCVLTGFIKISMFEHEQFEYYQYYIYKRQLKLDCPLQCTFYHYLIHYRELGTTNWSNLGNIDSTMTSRNIPQLQQLTTYEWRQSKHFVTQQIGRIQGGLTQTHSQQLRLYRLNLTQIYCLL